MRIPKCVVRRVKASHAREYKARVKDVVRNHMENVVRVGGEYTPQELHVIHAAMCFGAVVAHHGIDVYPDDGLTITCTCGKPICPSGLDVHAARKLAYTYGTVSRDSSGEFVFTYPRYWPDGVAHILIPSVACVLTVPVEDPLLQHLLQLPCHGIQAHLFDAKMLGLVVAREAVFRNVARPEALIKEAGKYYPDSKALPVSYQVAEQYE